MSFWITWSSSPVSPSFTSSKTLKCLTCVKPLKSSACSVRAVRAATAELDRGIAPAVLNLQGVKEGQQTSAKPQQSNFCFRYAEDLGHRGADRVRTSIRGLQGRKLVDSIHLPSRSMTENSGSGKITIVALFSPSISTGWRTGEGSDGDFCWPSTWIDQ